MVAAQFITAVQCIVSRNTSPTESCVVTLGKIEGGVAPNVIATSVRLMGTVRTFTAPVKRMVQRRLVNTGLVLVWYWVGTSWSLFGASLVLGWY